MANILRGKVAKRFADGVPNILLGGKGGKNMLGWWWQIYFSGLDGKKIWEWSGKISGGSKNIFRG